MTHPNQLSLWRAATSVLLLVCLLLATGVATQPPPVLAEPWEVWVTKSYRLQPGEAMQFRVEYAQIPVRSWRLVVESDYLLCDLHVLRMTDESLLYFEADESHHMVDIPWGRGEEISAVLTCGRRGGLFSVSYLGPPHASAPAAYSYEVNRALEAYTAGQMEAAEELLQAALAGDPEDGVAMVLLAGFMRDHHFYGQAEDLVQKALTSELPPDIQELAQQLATELESLHMPLAPELQTRLLLVERQLVEGEAAKALASCDSVLSRPAARSSEVRSRALLLRGRALHALDRHFEAVDTFTRALTATRSREDQAVIYFHMGWLYIDMDNLAQAEGAFNVARQYGLPSGMDVQAAEAVRWIQGSKR